MKMNEIEFSFFTWLLENYSPTFLDSSTASIYDDDYYYSIAYSMTLSEAYINLIDKVGLEDANEKMYSLLSNRYLKKWENEYSLLTQKYDALISYSETEKENVGTKVSTSVENDFDVYGFNSESAVNSSDSKTTTNVASNKVDNERESTKEGTSEAKSKLLEKELLLRERWQFFHLIYSDISTLLCSYYIN